MKGRKLDREREWSPEELRGYLMTHGWKPTDFRPGEVIPQGVKFISFEPVSENDIARAKELVEKRGAGGS